VLLVPAVMLANVSEDAPACSVADVAVPLNITCCGLPAALSVNEIAPVRIPLELGVNMTRMEQLALTARLAPHVLVWAKSPEAAMLVIESAAVPLLDKVTACEVLVVPTAWLANAKLVGDILTTGSAATAVPVTEIVPGLLLALLTTEIVPDCAPAAVGEKVTVSVDDCPEPRVTGKLTPLVWNKLLLLLICEIVTLALPVLFKTAVAVELPPTETVPNERLAGDTPSVPATVSSEGYSYAPMSYPAPCGRGTPS